MLSPFYVIVPGAINFQNDSVMAHPVYVIVSLKCLLPCSSSRVSKVLGQTRVTRHNRSVVVAAAAAAVRSIKGCLHYDTSTPYMYVVQVYGVHVS